MDTVYQTKSLKNYIRRRQTCSWKKTIAGVKAQVQIWKKEGLSVGLVPTMGYLHEGHRSLIDRAVRENDRVVVSVFVNPIQFGPTEDLESYPRDLEADCRLCEDAGAAPRFQPGSGRDVRAGFLNLCGYAPGK